MLTMLSIFLALVAVATTSYAQEGPPALTSDQLFGIRTQTPGTIAAANNPFIPMTAYNKYDSPVGVTAGASLSNAGVLRNMTIYYPDSGALFAQDGGLGGQFTALLNQIEATPYVIPYFTQLHTAILHALSAYLQKLYLALNITHNEDVKTYLTTDAQQAVNQKTLIINHLVNLVEAQTSQAMTMRFPGMPKQFAAFVGNALIKQDNSANQQVLLQGQEDTLLTGIVIQDGWCWIPPGTPTTGMSDTAGNGSPKPEPLKDTNGNPRAGQWMWASGDHALQQIKSAIADQRDKYLTIFGTYLNFFKNFTATLDQPDTSTPLAGLTRFARIATTIGSVIDQASTVDASSIKTLRNTKMINPPMFFFNPDTLRSIKMVPRLAQTLPANTQNVPWPKQMVDYASSGALWSNEFQNQIYGGLQIAFSTDAKGNPQANGSRLFMNIPLFRFDPPTSQNGRWSNYVQELLPQPAWLSSTQGIMKMLKACLGSFSELLDPAFSNDVILDPCLTCILATACSKAQLPTGGKENCAGCTSFLQDVQKVIQDNLPNIGPGGLPTPSGDPSVDPFG